MEADWERPQYAPGGGDASVLFIVFGPKPNPLRVTSLAHRVVPMDLALELEYQDPQVASGLLVSPFGQSLLLGWQGDDAATLAAEGCMVMRAEVPDPKDLRYFRNCVGVVTAILEAGGRAAANVQSLGMFTAEQWRAVIFAPDTPQPRLHVNVCHGEEEGGAVWVHSRGLRAFGRPDLSIRNVPADALPAASELCNRLIEAQAFGEVIADGKPIDLPGLAEGLAARHQGHLEDPDFNNVHIELTWSSTNGAEAGGF